MEIAPVARGRDVVRRLLLVVLVAALGWVLLLTVVPEMLGLSQTTTHGADAFTGLGPGTVVLARGTASGDVAVGDLVLAAAGPARLGLVTATPPGRLVVGGAGGQVSVTPTLDQPTSDRVVLAVPYVGLPLVALDQPGRLAVVAVLAGGVVLLARRGPGRSAAISAGRPRAAPRRPALPVVRSMP